MTTAQKMMGFESPSDQKVAIRVGDWQALKLALWRSKVAWEIAAHQAEETISRCEHVAECPGEKNETEPCRSQCPDREQRMSALVILNAARMHAPINARKPAEGMYFAPSREYFSETLASLAALQVENELLHEALRQAGIDPPSPPPDVDRSLPTRPAPALAQLEENNT